MIENPGTTSSGLTSGGSGETSSASRQVIAAITNGDPPPEGRILTHSLGPLLLIVIDRPRKLNGFSPSMLQQLAEAYTLLEQRSDVRSGVLLANGPNFTAGLELDASWSKFVAGRSLFPSGLVDPVSLNAPARQKPLVSAVQGICFTLGIELMLATDIVVASNDCRFSQMEVRRGIMPSEGATIRMVERAGWGNAQRYLLTGDEFGADEALRMGLVQQICPDVDTAQHQAIQIGSTIAAQAPLAVRASLASSRQYIELGFTSAARELKAAQRKLTQTEDASEGVLSFRERRSGSYQGR